jgi:L-alanine-DL-glutamate epimerase-like enolase superfamily enzyme
MKITKVETHVLLVPDYDSAACSSAQDDIVVIIHTDEGLSGIGETDTNPWVAEAMIHARGTHNLGLGLEEMLLGENPLNVEAIWEKLYTGSIMTGRRGLGICAIGAIDMALWDLRGKILGLPCWQILGGARKTHVTAYASLLPVGGTPEALLEFVDHKNQRSQAPWISCRKDRSRHQGSLQPHGTSGQRRTRRRTDGGVPRSGWS